MFDLCVLLCFPLKKHTRQLPKRNFLCNLRFFQWKHAEPEPPTIKLERKPKGRSALLDTQIANPALTPLALVFNMSFVKKTKQRQWKWSESRRTKTPVVRDNTFLYDSVPETEPIFLVGFPRNGFTNCLTFFSKFFFIFPSRYFFAIGLA